MLPRCCFCGKEISSEHYGITKKGSICLKCLRGKKYEISFVGVSGNLCSSQNKGRTREVS